MEQLRRHFYVSFHRTKQEPMGIAHLYQHVTNTLRTLQVVLIIPVPR